MGHCDDCRRFPSPAAPRFLSHSRLCSEGKEPKLKGKEGGGYITSATLLHHFLSFYFTFSLQWTLKADAVPAYLQDVESRPSTYTHTHTKSHSYLLTLSLLFHEASFVWRHATDSRRWRKFKKPRSNKQYNLNKTLIFFWHTQVRDDASEQTESSRQLTLALLHSQIQIKKKKSVAFVQEFLPIWKNKNRTKFLKNKINKDAGNTNRLEHTQMCGWQPKCPPLAQEKCENWHVFICYEKSERHSLFLLPGVNKYSPILRRKTEWKNTVIDIYRRD